jgi:hypothetical protein
MLSVLFRAVSIGIPFANPVPMQGIGRRFVYVLRSESDPERHYVGVTSDVGNRVDWHNHGPNGQTRRHRFAKRHFAPPETDS